MKINILLYWLFPFLALSQNAKEINPLNIVPNSSFEKYSSTPIGWFYKGAHYSEVMKYWHSPTGASPDVFGPKVRVPKQWARKGFGKQQARTGASMSGFTAFGCEEGKPHCREYIQIQLREALVPGQKYYAEFWLSPLPRSLRINNIGMYFSTKKTQEISTGVLSYEPQINTTHIIENLPNRWTKIAGTFTASAPSDYLTIGNFFSDSQTLSKASHEQSLKYAYYYIDDVKVIKQTPILEIPKEPNDLCCIEVEKGETIRLKNIFFDSGKSELLPRSYVELQKLLFLLEEHPSMKIEIRGHTDTVGDDSYNLKLSAARAAAVVSYLNQFGIDSKRTTFKGFGSTSPIADNALIEGRRLNRRVEFLVLEK